MNDERKFILNMLKENKISEEEALRLLDAIEGPKENTDFEESAKSIANKFLSGLDSALKKTSDVISGIDTSDWTLGFGPNREKKEDIIKENIDESIKSINIDNLNGRTHIFSWDNDYIEIRANISYDRKKVPANHEFILTRREDDYFYIKSNQTKVTNKFSINLSIALPRKDYDSLALSSGNGSIELNFIQGQSIEVSSINGSIECNSINAKRSMLETSQGSIQINDFKADSLSANTTNGSIFGRDLSAKDFIGQTINGQVNLSDFNTDAKTIDVSTINGNIALSALDFNRPIKALVKSDTRNIRNELLENFSNIEKTNDGYYAYSPAYTKESDDKLLIKASTVNGRISIK